MIKHFLKIKKLLNGSVIRPQTKKKKSIEKNYPNTGHITVATKYKNTVVNFFVR